MYPSQEGSGEMNHSGLGPLGPRPNVDAADPARIRSDSPLTQRQTAPYVVLCGCTVRITSENSPYCGQVGRVRRVFWRERKPWARVRFCIGGMTAIPWDWTDLPVPPMGSSAVADERASVLLSPTALRDLVRFLGTHDTPSHK